MKGKLIVVEGTDCSGKETQSNKLVTILESKGYKVFKTFFPFYDSPTGKMIGGPYLGKTHICESWFPEGAANVPPKVASLFYAADRLYNINVIEQKLEEGYIVILDRYVSSNMGHQAGKAASLKEAKEIVKWLEKLEYDLIKLPRPDLTIFLYMPFEVSKILKANREESADGHESDEKHLKDAEKMYLYLAEKYDYKKINCAFGNKPRSIEDISKDVLTAVEDIL